MRLHDKNSRHLQYARAFDRITSLFTNLWLFLFLALCINIVAAMALRFWPAAREAAGIEMPLIEQKPEAEQPLLEPQSRQSTQNGFLNSAGVGAPAALHTATAMLMVQTAESSDELPAVSPEPEQTAQVETIPTPPSVTEAVVTADADKLGELPQEIKAIVESAPAEPTTSTITAGHDKPGAEILPLNENYITEAPPEIPAANESQDAAAASPATPATPAAPIDDSKVAEADLAKVFVKFLNVLLPILRVGVLIASIMLMAALALALHLVLLGRLGGADRITAAFIWSLMLVLMSVPWSSAFAGFPLPAVTMLPGEIVSMTNAGLAAGGDWTTSALYWARAAGYPLLALLVSLAIAFQWIWSRRPVNDSLPQSEIDEEETERS